MPHVTPRLLFVTIGQSPRPDLIPEMRSRIGELVDVEERGALDGLDRAAIQAMAPRPGEHRLVTRLADGSETIVGKDATHRRLQAVFDAAAADDFVCTVLLCTGRFPAFRVSGLFLDAQSIVDESVATIARHARTIGLMLPLREQIDEFHFRPAAHQTMRASYASPYSPGRLEQAASDLKDADVIVMHCMGYSEAMRRTVAAISARPVLLARRLVASAVAQLV